MLNDGLSSVHTRYIIWLQSRTNLGKWSLNEDYRTISFKVETMLGMTNINDNPDAAVTAYLVYDYVMLYGEWSLA